LTEWHVFALCRVRAHMCNTHVCRHARVTSREHMCKVTKELVEITQKGVVMHNCKSTH